MGVEFLAILDFFGISGRISQHHFDQTGRFTNLGGGTFDIAFQFFHKGHNHPDRPAAAHQKGHPPRRTVAKFHGGELAAAHPLRDLGRRRCARGNSLHARVSIQAAFFQSREPDRNCCILRHGCHTRKTFAHKGSPHKAHSEPASREQALKAKPAWFPKTGRGASRPPSVS